MTIRLIGSKWKEKIDTEFIFRYRGNRTFRRGNFSGKIQEFRNRNICYCEK